MTTKNKKRTASQQTANAPTTDLMLQGGQTVDIALDQIDLSPLNYRKHYNPEALQKFSEELAQHGLIAPLRVRPHAGRYELVVGERRYRACLMAGFPSVPCIVQELSDEQVREIQLVENIQRENPHPLHEAQGIKQMQLAGKSMEQISARLGRSKQYLFGRLRLLSLISAFQEMFLADRMSLRAAFDLAALCEASQQELFDDDYTDWQEDPELYIADISDSLGQYQNNLNAAPFDTSDPALVPQAGACTTCPFNSATLNTLFPELAQNPTCSNRQCYRGKCQAHVLATVGEIVREHQPQAILYSHTPGGLVMEAVQALPGMEELPKFSRYDVQIVAAPQPPLQEDYVFDPDEEDQEGEPDEEGFEAAKAEYEEDLRQFLSDLESGHVKKALLLNGQQVELVLFSPSRRSNRGGEVTAKQVQEALKNGSATPELLEAEIERIKNRERRALELDAQKVQTAIYQAMEARTFQNEDPELFSDVDEYAARFLIYNSMSWNARNAINETIFANKEVSRSADLYEHLVGLTDQQFALLIRAALLDKAEAKLSTGTAGHCLRELAAATGVDTSGIQQSQQDRADARQEQVVARIATLEKKIQRLRAKTM